MSDLTILVHGDIDKYYFPVNLGLLDNLIGKVLTQIETMNLRERNEKATKDVFKQLIWNWFGIVQENSVTSYQNCIAPIYKFGDGTVGSGGTNRWDRRCANGCHETPGATCSECPPAFEAESLPPQWSWTTSTGTANSSGVVVTNVVSKPPDGNLEASED